MQNTVNNPANAAYLRGQFIRGLLGVSINLILLICLVVGVNRISDKLDILIENTTKIEQIESVKLDTLTLNEENFRLVCDAYGVQYPDVVWAQARLESGHFTSPIFLSKNNCLGLYDSRCHDYYSFSHWSDCIKGYRDLVQYKYTGTDSSQEYMNWLVNLPYATDPLYITKVQKLITQ